MYSNSKFNKSVMLQYTETFNRYTVSEGCIDQNRVSLSHCIGFVCKQVRGLLEFSRSAVHAQDKHILSLTQPQPAASDVKS